MKAILYITILFGVMLCSSRGNDATAVDITITPNAPQKMSKAEIDALVQEYLNQPPAPWGERSLAIVIEAFREADSNAVNTIRDILTTDRYRREFFQPGVEDWKAESSYLRWQQFAAVQVAKRPDVFGEILVTYYFDSHSLLRELSIDQQIRRAALKLIQQGPLYVAKLDADGMKDDATERYSVDKIIVGENSATAEAAFHKPLAGRGYQIRFKKIMIQEIEVWIPVEKKGTCIS